ncbi:hypothetical protein GCM10010236_33500 [Streptomyces eurythermus]|nr:hypothetical protein GCM10010236_33500 [Streptomyces eurythermus]
MRRTLGRAGHSRPVRFAATGPVQAGTASPAPAAAHGGPRGPDPGGRTAQGVRYGLNFTVSSQPDRNHNHALPGRV